MTRRLKILMIAPNPYFVDRGFSVHVFEQARALRDLGHDVAFTTYHCGRDLGDFRYYRSLDVPWYKATETGGSLHRIYIDAFLLATTRRAIRREQPDIIHGHIHEGAMIGVLSVKSWNPALVVGRANSAVIRPSVSMTTPIPVARRRQGARQQTRRRETDERRCALGERLLAIVVQSAKTVLS